MRELRAIRTLGRIAATQTALRSASQVDLTRALDLERACEVDVRHEQALLKEAIEDWRSALEGRAVDAALLNLFAQAPRTREVALNAAQAAHVKAQVHSDAQRVRHGEITARLEHLALLRKRITKRLDRKQEEKVLSRVEQVLAPAST